VRGLLESLRRDTYPNPPFTGEESQTDHRGGLDRNIPPEGKTFVNSLKLSEADRQDKITTLKVKTSKCQLIGVITMREPCSGLN
jgi:hypothetical protein